jgi:hypothetical protein
LKDQRPPSAFSDGHESRRRRESAQTPRQHAKPPPHAGIGKEKRTFGFIRDSFKNMQGGMLADSSFLKNIFYFSKYEKDMINDETIEFMRDLGVLRCFHAIDATRLHGRRRWVVDFSSLRPFGPRRGRRGVSEGPQSRRWREVARTDAVAAKASARCRMRVYTSQECTEAVS